MRQILLAALVAAIAICGVNFAANSQSNPGFNPNLQWCGTQGSVAIRGASNWQCLLPGTAGQSLLSGGAGANPYWNTISGTGTVTSVNGSGGTTGLTVSGGPITGAGTLTLGGTLAIASGGTGGTGAANTVLRSNGTANSFGKIAAGDFAAGAIVNADVSASAAIAPSKLAAQGALTVLANITGGSAVPTTPTVTALLDAAFTSTQGSVLYRNVSGWGFLTPGTNGQFLATGGAGANPAWQTVTGGNIGSIPNGTVLANISGSTAPPANPTVSQLLDATISTTQGALIYRNNSQWLSLAPGTAGTLLQSGGAGSNPLWSTKGQIAGEPSTGTASAGNIGETISSVVVSGSAVSLPAGSARNVTSISLPAGDWDVSGSCFIGAGAGSVIQTSCSISTTSATRDFTPEFYDVRTFTFTAASVNDYVTHRVGPARASLSGATTYYMVGYYGGSGTGNLYGHIRARRMR